MIGSRKAPGPGETNESSGPSALFWSQRYERSRCAVRRVRGLVDGLPAGAGRDWLATLVDDLDRQLAAVRRTTCLGELLDPDPDRDPEMGVDPASPAVRDCADRVEVAARELEEIAERVATVAVSLVPAPDVTEVRDQLDMLSTQAPVLRPTVRAVAPPETPPRRVAPSAGPARRHRPASRRTESFRDCGPIIGTGAAGAVGAWAAWTFAAAPSLTLRLTCLSLLAIFVPMLVSGLTMWLVGPDAAGRYLRPMWPMTVVAAFVLLIAGAFADGLAEGVVLLAALIWPLVLAGGCGVAAAAGRLRSTRRRQR